MKRQRAKNDREIRVTNAVSSPRWVSPLLMAILVTATTIAFLPGLDGEFVNWDDDRNFVDNPRYRGLGLEQLHWAATTFHVGAWQPVSWVILATQYELGGMEPRVYHATSLLQHAINAVVFYWLTLLLLIRARSNMRSDGDRASPSGMRFCAFAAAMLFAVHPLRVEVVSWNSCQPYLPTALFIMLTLAIYVRGFGSENTSENHSARYWRTLALTFACFLLAVMSKAIAVSLPALMLILDVYPLKRVDGLRGVFSRTGLRVVLEKLPFIGVAVFVAILAALAKDYDEARAPFYDFDANARFSQTAYGMVFYVWKSFFPTGLIPYVRLPDDLGLTTGRFAACAIGVAAITITSIALRRRRPAMLAALAAYCLILLPNLGIVQIAQQTAADRYSYVGIMPLMVLLAGAMLRIWETHHRHATLLRSATVLSLVLASMFLIQASRRQTLVWRDSLSVWNATLHEDPKCAVAECNLGEFALEQERYRDASQHLSRAIDLRPDFSFAYCNFAVILCRAERYDAAITTAELALAGVPPLRDQDLARTHAVLGQAYAGLRRDDLAWKHTRIAEGLGFEKAGQMIEFLRTVSQEPRPDNESCIRNGAAADAPVGR